MKKRTNIIRYTVFILISAAMIAMIILEVFKLIRMNAERKDIEDNYLVEQAAAIDSALMNQIMLNTSMITSAVQKDVFRMAEERYTEYNDTEWLLEEVLSSDFFHSEYVVQTLALSDGEVLFSCENGVKSAVSQFPENFKGPCALVRNEEGDACIAFSAGSAYHDFEYVVVFSLSYIIENMREHILEGQPDIILYDPAADILAAEISGSLSLAEFKENGTSVSEIISAVKSLENADRTDTRISAYHDEQNKRHDLVIALIPSDESINGCLSVGTAVDYTEYVNNNIRSSKSSIITWILVFSEFIMFSLLQYYFFSNERHKRKAHETEEELKNTKLLEHRDRLETIGILTSSIVHDISNVMTPVMSYSEMSLGELTDENLYLANNLAEIYKASSKARNLISRITSYSRTNSDQAFQYLSPDEIIEEVLQMTRPAMPGKVAVQLSLSCPEPCIYGDRLQLMQLFMNLIVNAYQAMSGNEGEVTIQSELKDGKVKVSVRDTGKGMTEEEKKRIFEPYFTTKGEAGTGLGLMISDRIAKAHGAEIEFDSTLGEGTEFIVIFPENSKTE